MPKLSTKSEVAYAEAINRIEACKMKGRRTLDLSKLGLTKVPPEIGQLTTLKSLFLYANQLTRLPSEIVQLANLTSLYLSYNQFTALPLHILELKSLRALSLANNLLRGLSSGIGQLTTLTELNFDRNELRTLPPEIGHLNKLTSLYLGNNQLTSLPLEIGRLTALKSLHLNSNRLTTLPPEIGQLTNLTLLHIYNNELTTLPPEFGQLKALATLDLSNNKLTTLPLGIGQLSSLAMLDLFGNRFKTLPPEIGKLSSLTSLDLSGNQITTLPPEIGQLSSLTSLDLSGNQITTLPPEIGQLSSLSSIDCTASLLTTLPAEIGQLSALTSLELLGSRLEVLPPQIGQLTSLRNLGLCSNQLTRLPPEIGHLVGLTTLDLSDNQLTTLPMEIGQLTGLMLFDLRGNKLKTLPSEIGQLTALTTLHLGENLLISLPQEIGHLDKLTKLWVHDNHLTGLPARFKQLTSMKVLNISDNPFERFPEEICHLDRLTELWLQGTQLTALPLEIRKLTTLNVIYLHDNPALGIPPEVLGPTWDLVATSRVKPKPPQEILDYFFDLQNAQRQKKSKPLNEAKVLILGQPEAGKSSLIHALTAGWPTPDIPKTDGISRCQWSQKVKDGNVVAKSKRRGEMLRLNLWDFGGQEIYKATHTFFLTRRAVYVIVTTARKDTSMDNDLEEWLETARAFGGDAPVWVVINKHDENPTGGPDESALIRKYHPMLRGFIRTQCQHAKSGPDEGTGAGRGIDELRNRLVAEAWAMPEVRQPMSTQALAIKRHLEKMKKPTLTVDDYRELCKKLGESSVSLQSTLLDLWDKLGTVRYFPEGEDDAPSMRETAILNPEWVTDAVYKVLEDPKLKAANGLITEADLDRIMKTLKHTAGSYHLIANVMRRFSQLYDAGDGRMFIPQLLDDREPELEWPAKSLRFVYVYPVLPPGLVPTFIAKMHKYHDEHVCPWRRGCVLNVQGCRVRVIGDKKLRQVEISVIGEQTSKHRDALDQVRFKFDELHHTVTGLDTLKELIPVPGHPSAPLLDYRFLRTLEDEGETHHRAPIDAKSTASVRVSIADALGSVRGMAMKAQEDEMKRRGDIAPIQVNIKNIQVGGDAEGNAFGENSQVRNLDG